METPSSTRRVTRSQASAALSNNTNCFNKAISVSRKTEDSEKSISKSRQRNGKQQDRSALIDITNDSPIVGLTSGNLETPSSAIAKQRGSRIKDTPGSGEALLRGQVKTLLQKVEEEAELSKLSLESRPFLQLVTSPVGLLAPTPANTPQIPNLSGSGCLINNTGLASVTPSSIIEEQLISQVVNNIFDGKNQENPESEKSLITRSLLLDFSEKSEISDSSECSSELTYQEVTQGSKEKASAEDDDASIWSIQVNASTHDEDEEKIAKEEDEEEADDYKDIEEEEADDYKDIEEEEADDYKDIEEEEDCGDLLDELCEGMNNISVNEKEGPKFAGKHTRFVYNSDDDLVGEEDENCVEIEAANSPNVLHLKGLPTPKGKHLRFPEEEEGRAV